MILIIHWQKSLAPFILARTWSTLDHVTRGRIAWNVVTSYSNSAAQAMGHDKVKPSEERYKAAHEYMDLVYQWAYKLISRLDFHVNHLHNRLWERSWEDGAVKWQIEPEEAYDPTKIHKIDFDGEFHRYFHLQYKPILRHVEGYSHVVICYEQKWSFTNLKSPLRIFCRDSSSSL